MNASLASVIGMGEFSQYDGATMVAVSLSQRNLLDLVAQMESGRDFPALSRFTEDGYMLTVRVEPDDVHYGEREPGPGGVGKVYDATNPFPPQTTNEP